MSNDVGYLENESYVVEKSLFEVEMLQNSRNYPYIQQHSIVCINNELWFLVINGHTGPASSVNRFCI